MGRNVSQNLESILESPNTSFPTRTKSICPECLEEGKVKVIDAFFKVRIGERGEQVYMEKECEEHGIFEERIGKKELLERWYRWKIDGERKVTITQSNYGCPQDCGLCPDHKSQTVLGIIDVTNRCNLNCRICFDLPEKVGYLYEPSLKEIKRAMLSLRESGAKALQLTGGEPTVLENLEEYVRLAKQIGFEHVEVNTNGLRIAEEGPSYVKKLKDAGVSTYYLSFEGLTEGPYREKVGENPPPGKVLKLKKRFVDVCREAGHNSVVLVPTLVGGSNDKEAWGIVKYALENSDVIRCVNFQPVSIVGRIEKSERKRMRITTSDLVELLEEQSKGAVSKYDFYPGSFLAPISDVVSMIKGKKYFKFSYHPWCGVATFLIKDEGEWKPITRLGNVERLMEEFSEAYRKYEAEQGYLRKKFRKLKSIFDVWRSMKRNLEERLYKEIISVVRRGDYRSTGDFMRKIVMVGDMHFMDPYNFDLERVQRCVIHYGLPDGKIIPFCTMNTIHREKIVKKFSKPLKGSKSTSRS